MNKAMQYALSLILVLALGSSSYYRLIGLEKKAPVDVPIGYLLTDNDYNTKNFREKNQKLFQKLGIAYLRNIEIISADIKQLDAKHTDRYIKNPIFFDNLEKKYRTQISRGYVAPISVRFINNQIGYGVFAEADIAADQLIGEYTGKVLNINEIQDTKYTWDYLTSYDKHGRIINVSLDAKSSGNEMRFVNHDYHPNVKVQYIPQDGKWHVCYIAIRPILKNEQILVNYGKSYWSGARGAPYQFVSADGSQGLVL